MSSTNGNRPTTNWAAAKAFWLALPPEHRTYLAVAERFGVTRGRVSQVAARDGWPDTLAGIERRAEQRVVAGAVRTQADRIARTLELGDRLVDLGLQRVTLTADGVTVDDLATDQLLRRIPGVVKLGELLAGRATASVEISEVQPVLIAVFQVAITAGREGWPAERTLAALKDATAGLVALGAAPA